MTDMTETAAAIQTREAPAFPADRTCPYQLPESYRQLRDEPDALNAVTLFDGRRAWVVTKHETARKLLADPAFPRTAPATNSPPHPRVSRPSGRSARPSSVWIRPNTGRADG